MKTQLSVAKSFSRFPAGRYLTDGPYSGEAFRNVLVESLEHGSHVTVQLDGTMGYGSSFLEEAFGGLVRECNITAADLHSRMLLETSDASLEAEVWSYVDTAMPRVDVSTSGSGR